MCHEICGMKFKKSETEEEFDYLEEKSTINNIDSLCDNYSCIRVEYSLVILFPQMELQTANDL